MTRLSVAFFVSGHGFGHSVRCAEVARVFVERGARVLLRTDAPRWLFGECVELIGAPGDWPLDIGVAQHDGLELDIDETRRRWTHFAAEFDVHAEAEARSLATYGVDAVLGDIPPLAFETAARAGVPTFALGNFGWDWIYAAWPGFEQIVARVQSAYARADALLRLPLHASTREAFSAFSRIEDVPLVARRAQRPGTEVRAELGISNNARVVLLSFGGFTARGLDLNALGDWTRYVFVVTPPLAASLRRAPANVVAVNETPGDYVSLLAACDVVVTKPGYGIVADCLANRVAMLFTDRGPFREYDVMAAALPTLGPARFLAREDLLRGYVGPHVDALLELDTPWTGEAMNGAEVVADLIERNVTSVQKR